MDLRVHWESIYSKRAAHEFSWFEPSPDHWLDFIGAVAPDTDAAVLEIGGGASSLVDRLLDRGYADLTVVDLSEGALAQVRERLGARASRVCFRPGDVRQLKLDRPVDLWHDRAVFHFLTAEEDRAAYLRALRETLRPGGHVVIATFALDGPEKCSGLTVARYSPETLSETLGDDYRLVRSVAHTHVTPTRKEQRFTYAAFQRAARPEIR